MKTAITLTSFDYDRLRALLDSPAGRTAPNGAILSDEIDRADIIDPSAAPSDLVTMNSTVRFAIEGGDGETESTLSFPRDADKQDKPRISILTPVGSALLGLQAGQNIEWRVPSGKTVTLRVIAVTWQPEAHGEDLGE
ncbi:MAG: nucleoside diphosphate kinase regulator [Rhodocyclaceae bacterium]